MAKSNTKPTAKKAPKKGKSTAGNKGTNVSKILVAIAGQHALGKEKPEKKVVQGMAGILDKKIFDTVCGAMKNKKGLIVYDKETIELTDKGREEVGDEALEVPTNNDAFHDKIKEGLKSKKGKQIFDILADGRTYSKEQIAEKLGVEINKSFGTYLSHVSKYAENKGGNYRLKDDAFVVGRPCDKE